MRHHHANLFRRALPTVDAELAKEIQDALDVYESWDGILVDRERDIVNVGDLFTTYGSRIVYIVTGFDNDDVRYVFDRGRCDGSMPRAHFEAVAKLEGQP